MQTPIIQTLDSNGEQIRYQSVPIVPLYGSREQVIVMTCYVGISPRPRVVPEDVWEMPAMPAPCLGIYAPGIWDLRVYGSRGVYGVRTTCTTCTTCILHDTIETNTHTDDHNWSHMGVSENSGTPKSSILIGFSITHHPFWGIPIFGNIHMVTDRENHRWSQIAAQQYTVDIRRCTTIIKNTFFGLSLMPVNGGESFQPSEANYAAMPMNYMQLPTHGYNPFSNFQDATCSWGSS